MPDPHIELTLFTRPEAAFEDPRWASAAGVQVVVADVAWCERFLVDHPPGVKRLWIKRIDDEAMRVLFALPPSIRVDAESSSVSPWLAASAPAHIHCPTAASWTPAWEKRVDWKLRHLVENRPDLLDALVATGMVDATELCCRLLESDGRVELAVLLRAMTAGRVDAYLEARDAPSTVTRDENLEIAMGIRPAPEDPLDQWLTSVVEVLSDLPAPTSLRSVDIALVRLARALRRAYTWNRYQGVTELVHLTVWLYALLESRHDDARDAVRWDGVVADELLAQIEAMV